ncbi:hypothetical protein PMAYCL1PPCAC_09242, partial [Pristionchus mayeri]
MSGIYGYGQKKIKQAKDAIGSFVDAGRAIIRRIFPNEKPKPEVVIAIKDYNPVKGEKGTAFKKGDRFNFVKKQDANTNWWHVVPEGQKDGKVFAPSNYLIRERDMPDYELISFNTDRNRAETLLKSAELENGSFIIRADTSNFNCPNLELKLSFKDVHINNGTAYPHFKIMKFDKEYMIENGKNSFKSISELVEHYADYRHTTNIALKYSVKKKSSVMLWDYKNRKIEKGEPLGKGYFGEVFKGTLFGNEIVALKTPNLQRMDAEDFLKEAEIARYCKHPHVLETIGICSSPYYILTEYMAKGNLKKYFETNDLSAEQCLSIARKIASGMEYLAGLQIVHRDLAARNILIGETLDIIKISDFGLARSLETQKYYTTCKEAFPIRWTAPEGIVLFQEGIVPTKEGKIEYAVDVWSFGVVLWEIYTNGKEPYEGISDADLFAALTKSEPLLRLPKPEKCPQEVYDKMLECWNLDKHARPSFSDLHSFLSQLSGEEPAAAAAAA